jgi:hypothetical protein
VFGTTVAELHTFEEAMATLLLCLFGNYDVAIKVGELYGFGGYLYYFFYMVIAFLLLMNMLLAILVDSYINVKTDGEKADGVLKDVYRQSQASIRAMTRPKDIVSNKSVVNKLESWLTKKGIDVDQQCASIPVAQNYNMTRDDVRRVLRHFLQSERALNLQTEGIINSESLNEDVEDLARAFEYHYGLDESSGSCHKKGNSKDGAKVTPFSKDQKNASKNAAAFDLIRSLSPVSSSSSDNESKRETASETAKSSMDDSVMDRRQIG